MAPSAGAVPDTGADEGAVPPVITPYGFLARPEGDTGSQVYDLPVSLSHPATVPVTIDWATVDTSADPRVAEAGTDFVSAAGIVTFAPGETTQTIQIEILGDTVDEPPLLWGEWGLVTFSNPTNATLDTTTFFGHGLFIIIDDDADLPVITPGGASVSEGDETTSVVEVPATLSAPAPMPVTVEWSTVFDPTWGASAAQPGVDYVPASGVVTFAPGETEQTVGVTVRGDSYTEPDELLVVSFRHPTNASMGGYWGLGFGGIINDESASVVVTPGTGQAGGQQVTVVASGFTPGAELAWCQGGFDPGGPVGTDLCGAPLTLGIRADSGGTATFTGRLERFMYPPRLGRWIDCADPAEACGLGVGEIANQQNVAAALLDFAPPPEPPANRGTVEVSPASGLAPGDVVTATGAGFRPGAVIDLFQCLPGAGHPEDCSRRAASVTTDGEGAFSTPLTVAQLVLPPGLPSTDCAALVDPCVIAAAEAVDFPGTVAAAPVTITPPVLPPARLIAAGSNHTCAVTTSDGVKCWGRNDRGQLGDGTTNGRLTPVDVTGLAAGVRSVSTGSAHTCALTSALRDTCWGANDLGQLSDAGIADQSAPTDTVLPFAVADLGAGGEHTCAATTDGEVWCQGSNSDGQVGTGDMGPWQSAPGQVVGLTDAVAVVTGDDHACALVADGSVSCWGDNSSGQLGDGTFTDRRTPVQVVPAGVAAALTAGARHTCLLTRPDFIVGPGAVLCWGDNSSGQLGDGTTNSSPSPQWVTGLGFENVSSLSTNSIGSLGTCVVTTAGGLKCWGGNASGQIGDGTTSDRLVPTDVSGLAAGVQAVTTSGSHTCAVLTGGGIRCWGANPFGELGDGTTTSRLTPVDVVGF